MSPIPHPHKYYLIKYKVITEKEEILPQCFVPDVINNSGYVIVDLRYCTSTGSLLPKILLTYIYIVVCGIIFIHGRMVNSKNSNAKAII